MPPSRRRRNRPRRHEVRDLGGLISNLSGLVSDLRQETSSGDLRQTLRQAAALLTALNRTVENTDLQGTVAELHGLATDARKLVGG